MGENLKVVWAKFSALSLAVLVMSVTVWYRQTNPHLKLKTLPMFCPVVHAPIEPRAHTYCTYEPIDGTTEKVNRRKNGEPP
jgi:hypothetical protein